MPITLQCPNTTCGQMLNIRDEYAGKNGKCPACGSVIAIPARSSKETSPRIRPGPREEPAPEPTPPPFDPQPIASPSPVPEEEPLIRKPFHRDPQGLTMPLLAAGLFALVVLSFSTQLRWVYVSYSAERAGGGRLGRDEETLTATMSNVTSDMTTLFLSATIGPHLLFYSAGIALLALVTLTLTQLLSKEQVDGVIVSTGSLAVGWGVAAGMWLLGFFWKILTIWSDAPKGVTVFPNFGLFLGLLAALAIVLAFGYLVFSRGKLAWLLTAASMGFALGLFLFLINAKPWNSWGGKGFGPF